MARNLYVLMVEDLSDNMGEPSFRVTLAENGLEIGDGVASSLVGALMESIRESGITEGHL